MSQKTALYLVLTTGVFAYYYSMQNAKIPAKTIIISCIAFSMISFSISNIVVLNNKK